MHFDDRLATVLRQRAAGERAARTQYRQLLDLLGQRADGAGDELEESGWERLSNLTAQIPAGERAAILREGGWRFRNPSLILFLAEQEPDVAASALSVVELSPQDWVLLIPELPVRARGFLRLRRDLPEPARALLDRLGVRDRGLPAPERVSDPEPEQPAGEEQDVLLLGNDAGQTSETPAAALKEAPQFDGTEAGGMEHADARGPLNAPSSGADAGGRAKRSSLVDGDAIGALVRRIEAFQEARRASAATPAGEPTRARPADEATPFNVEPDEGGASLQSFVFATDVHGNIDWADPQAAPMVVGTPLRALARQQDDVDGFELELDHHLPLRHKVVDLAGATPIEGSWVLDAMPSFAARGGSFQGYLGRFVRFAEPSKRRASMLQERADRLRQLLHELRTPVNAIQGYAELIQQEVVGRTPHAYRALAAAIGGDSARILSGFDDLERLSRLESGSLDLVEGRSELHDILAATVRQLRPTLQSRGAGFDLVIRAADTAVPMARPDAELLLWRILASIAAGTNESEVVEVRLEVQDRTMVLLCGLSRDLRDCSDLFATDFRLDDDMVNPGIFGVGFALRLARAEARSVGGELRRDGGRLILTLPVSTSAYGSSSKATLAEQA